MRYITTSAATVDSLKKQAKKLQRKSGGKHADLLDRVARSAGYDHWHHVTLCLKQFEAKSGLDALNAECDLVVAAAGEGKSKIIVTGPETLTVPLVLFAAQGDAWMLDADEGLATCLVWQSEVQDREIEDTGKTIEVGWDGPFTLEADALMVDTTHPAIGKRRIHGYPLDELRAAIDKAQSFDKRFNDIFMQDGAQELTPDLIERLAAQGWERKVLEDSAREGARYSPSRNTLLTPAFSGGFGTDDDENEGPTDAGPSMTV